MQPTTSASVRLALPRKRISFFGSQAPVCSLLAHAPMSTAACIAMDESSCAAHSFPDHRCRQSGVGTMRPGRRLLPASSRRIGGAWGHGEWAIRARNKEQHAGTNRVTRHPPDLFNILSPFVPWRVQGVRCTQAETRAAPRCAAPVGAGHACASSD